jgi:hypothetical protein
MIWRAGTLAIVAVTFGTLGMFIADRAPPTTVYNAEPEDQHVIPGGTLRIKYSVYRTRSCATSVERMLYDSKRVRYILEDLEFKASPGPLGPDGYTSIIPIPAHFARGEGRYRALTTYRCNPIHSLWPISVLTADVTFDVTGP